MRGNRNCLAGAWPQLEVLLTAFCSGTARTAGDSPRQPQDIGCLVELVEALPYTPHAGLLVLQVTPNTLVTPVVYPSQVSTTYGLQARSKK